MAEVKIDPPKPTPTPPPMEGQWVTTRPPIDTIREDVFNEVIYGLEVLFRACGMADYPNVKGISFALDYVKAMKEME